MARKEERKSSENTEAGYSLRMVQVPGLAESTAETTSVIRARIELQRFGVSNTIANLKLPRFCCSGMWVSVVRRRSKPASSAA